MAMLEVIIGMIFTFMLLSLLGTTLNELVSAWRGWRGLYLEEALKRLLEHKQDPKVFDKFIQNPLFQQMMQHSVRFRKSQAPAYLSSSNFSSILANVLKKKDKAVQQVDDFLEGLPTESQLRKVLEQFKEEGHTTLDAFKARIQLWFDDVMAQSSGWYKRHLQFVTFFMGLGIAIALNADSFQIYSHLSTNANTRQQMSLLASAFVNQNPTLPKSNATADSTLDVVKIIKEVREEFNKPDVRNAFNILGLGWSQADFKPWTKENFKNELGSWASRLVGWLITALAISLGAPFWFDVLKKIITIQSTGSGGGSSGSGSSTAGGGK